MNTAGKGIAHILQRLYNSLLITPPPFPLFLISSFLLDLNLLSLFFPLVMLLLLLIPFVSLPLNPV